MNDLDPHQRSDQQLVADLAAGDTSATAELAQRYTSDLYDFAIRIVLDGAAAASVVESVLERAQGEIAEKPAFLGLRAWLLGQVRDTALEALRQRGRAEDAPDAVPTPLSPSDPMFVQTPDPSVNDLALWAWQASRGQRPRDYSLLDLALRRGLPAEEVAEIAGLSRTGIYSVLGRLRGTFEESFSATTLFYMGRQNCADLDNLATVGRELRPALRRDISRHAESCVHCRATLNGLPLASDLFALILNVGMPQDFVDHIEELYPPPTATSTSADSAVPALGAAAVAATAGTAATGIDALWDSEDDDEEPAEDEPTGNEAEAMAETVMAQRPSAADVDDLYGEEPKEAEPDAIDSLYGDPEPEAALLDDLYGEPEPEPEPEPTPPPAPSPAEVTLRAPRMPAADAGMLTTMRPPRTPPPPEPEPEVQQAEPSIVDSLYGGEEEDLLAPESLYDDVEEEEEQEPERIDRAVPLTFTRRRGRQPDSRAAAAAGAATAGAAGTERIRFERQDLYAKPQRDSGGGGSMLSGSRGIWIGILLIGIVLVCGYGGWAIGRSIDDSNDNSSSSAAALPTRAGGVKVLPCGSGPVTVDQGSSATLSLDPKALNGYQVTGVTVSPVSATANPTAVVAKTQGGNTVVFDAMLVPGAPGRLDEYKLSVTLTMGDKKAVSDCSVLVRASTTPVAGQPAGAPPAANTTPGAATTPAAAGTPAAARTPAAGTTPPAGGAPAGATATRVP